MLVAGPKGFEGGMTPRKYAAFNKSTSITSNRDLVDLVEKRLLVRGGGGRSTYDNLTIPGSGWRPAQGLPRSGVVPCRQMALREEELPPIDSFAQTNRVW
jgi:hypothetical protein